MSLVLSAFGDSHKVRGVFLDIFKVFDRVWHEAFSFKLQQNGISGELITLIRYFLSCGKQRILLNDQHQPWVDVKAGVSQLSIRGPLLFLIYSNDLPNSLNSKVKIFANYASLFFVVHIITNSTKLLNSDLSKINERALQWKMSFNPGPTNNLKRPYSVSKLQKEITQVLCLITTQLILLLFISNQV